CIRTRPANRGTSSYPSTWKNGSGDTKPATRPNQAADAARTKTKWTTSPMIDEIDNHDPLVCGLLDSDCPGCRAQEHRPAGEAPAPPTVDQLHGARRDSAERAGTAADAAWRLRAAGDQQGADATEEQRRELSGEYWAIRGELGQIGLLTLRAACEQ